jgi:polygalacturonase
MYRITITPLLFTEFCMTKIICLVFAASLAQAASFDITQYGTVGNGTTLASAAINKAIDAASVAGGGTVHFPAGTWLSGSIQLKSNVAPYFEQGSTLVATEDRDSGHRG